MKTVLWADINARYSVWMYLHTALKVKQCVGTHPWSQHSGRSEKSMGFTPGCYTVISRAAWVTEPVFGGKKKQHRFHFANETVKWSSAAHVFIRG